MARRALRDCPTRRFAFDHPSFSFREAPPSGGLLRLSTAQQKERFIVTTTFSQLSLIEPILRALRQENYTSVPRFRYSLPPDGRLLEAVVNAKDPVVTLRQE